MPLDEPRLRQLATLDHVARVVPLYSLYGWAMLDDRSQSATIASAAPDNERLSNRLIAGRFFESPTERSAVLGELLCYLLGVTDDASLERLLGRKVRLELRSFTGNAGIFVHLTKPDGGELTHREANALEKLRDRLPRSFDKLGLAADERDALTQALAATDKREGVTYTDEFTVVGVLRLPGKEDQASVWSPLSPDADIYLPIDVAGGLFFRQPAPEGLGADRAVVLADSEENVRTVLAEIKQQGLEAYAPVEWIDRERLLYLLVFTAMSCVAAVALLVAALGIANTMLMTVLERTREIGIFKAVGAADRHVQYIFLVEGACIGLLGGGLGVLLAWAASFPGDAWARSVVTRDLKIELTGSLFDFPTWLVGGALAFAIAVTTLAALYPARRASRVNPLEALRHE